MREILTQEKLKTLLHYEPETGEFTWLVAKGSRAEAGDVAGYRTKEGYIYIGVDGRLYGAHRLAFLYMTGSWPEHQVDHKDRDPGDNRWSRIRPSTNGQNNCNKPTRNKLGVKGVYPSGEKFQVQFKENGQMKCFGTFETLAEAKAVSLQQQTRIHGEFQCF